MLETKGQTSSTTVDTEHHHQKVKATLSLNKKLIVHQQLSIQQAQKAHTETENRGAHLSPPQLVTRLLAQTLLKRNNPQWQAPPIQLPTHPQTPTLDPLPLPLLLEEERVQEPKWLTWTLESTPLLQLPSEGLFLEIQEEVEAAEVEEEEEVVVAVAHQDRSSHQDT
jgi:hypothetical protein